MLKGFFSPRGIAVIGASFDTAKIGHVIVRNILEGGFKGNVYPVNPKGGEMLGLKVYDEVSQLPGDCDLAIFAVTPPKVLTEMAEVGKTKIRCALVITAGFKEVGGEGERLERELLEICLDHGINVVGPNCFGIHDTKTRLNTTFLDKIPIPGRIAFISQSGAVCVAILDWSLANGVGFSKFVSMGNKLDVDEAKLIDYLSDDPDTDVIVGYLESVKNGSAFLEASRRSAPKKPVILFKAGTTALGAKAASSHTGALAGSDAAFDAACRQTGIIRSPTMEQLFDLALVFSAGRSLKGNRIGVITNSGGPAVIATDSIERSSLAMAAISDAVKAKLRSGLPATANINNPVDIIGDATSERYRETFAVVREEKGIDGFLVIMTPTERLVPDEVARHIVELARAEERPVVSVFMGGESIENARAIAARGNAAVISTPERAVAALDALNRRRTWLAEDKSPAAPDIPNRSKAARLIEYAVTSRISHLTEQEARGILGAYGIRLVRSIMAQRPGDAAMIAENLGYPVVMKVVSRDVIHKSDAGGVKVGLGSASEVFTGYEAIMKSVRAKVPDARIDGVTIQPMLKGGKEIIVGASRDPQFGPLIMFGLGGIYVEAMRDVSFRLAGMSLCDARNMIEEIKSVSLLKGVRGEKPSDLGAVVDVIMRVAKLMTDFPRIRELDANPVMVFEEGQGAVALDARIALALES